MNPPVAAWLTVAIRIVLAGATLTAIASGISLLKIRGSDRVHQTALAWAVLVFFLLVARLGGITARVDSVTVQVSKIQYTLLLLQVPLALHLLDRREDRKHQGFIVLSTVLSALPLFGTLFATNAVVRYPDAFGTSIAYAVPGPLATVMLPYAVLVGTYVARALRECQGPDAALLRTVIRVVIVAVVPAGANDFLMTAGLARSVLLVDLASCLAVFGLEHILSRRAHVAYLDLARALEERRNEARRGAAEVRTASRLSELGAEVASVLTRLQPPVARIMSRVVAAEDAVLAAAAETPDLCWSEAKDVLAETREAATRVTSTLNVFEEFAKGGASRTVEADVRALVERALSVVGNELRHRARLVKEFDAVPPIAADPDRLVEAFVSLLVRAIRSIPPGATQRGGRIAVRVSRGDRTVVVRIADNGTPIPEPLLPRVFDPYVAADPDRDGSGLGLSLCHRIVTELGGKVSVGSTDAETAVVVELPTRA